MIMARFNSKQFFFAGRRDQAGSFFKVRRIRKAEIRSETNVQVEEFQRSKKISSLTNCRTYILISQEAFLFLMSNWSPMYIEVFVRGLAAAYIDRGS